MTAVAERTSVRFQPATADTGIASIDIDRPDDAVNAIDLPMIEQLGGAVRQARAAQPKGLIITSNKPGQWVAGADLKLVSQAADPEQILQSSRRLQAVCDELAWLPFTTVAAINGAALGGGLEIALACDYRVAADASSVSLGQPEVNLGLIPAGGGTQRLPRLIGLERALDLILTGRRLNARRAKRAGLLDEVVHPTILKQAARAWANKPKRSLERPIRLGFNLRSAIDLAEQTPQGRQLIYRQARQAVLKRTKGHYPAPLRALESVEAGFEHGMAAGLEVEATAFGDLARTQTARNLIWLFLATQHARRKGAPVSQSQLGLGVVGAGFMGAAIAEVAAVAGVPVRIKDVSPEAVARGLGTIRKLVQRFEGRERQAILERVSGSTDYSGFGFRRADVVVEAVFEQLQTKRKVIAELEEVLPEGAVIASNTSALPIREIAAEARHPERIVGMHFFSPAERMPLLEVVKPDAATDDAVQTAVALGVKMGKTPIVVADSPGFYTSRVLAVMMNEAALLVGEGARLEDVDDTMTAFGFPVGPFVLYDEVGLQVAAHAGETVAQAFGDRVPTTHFVEELVNSGATGKKVGAGFYFWGDAKFLKKPTKRANPLVYGDVPRRDFGRQEIQDRLALLFVNEAARCLDEGVIQSATDGDLGAVLGLGFPPFRGGPFHYIDQHSGLRDQLTSLAARRGPRYLPAESITSGRKFFEEHA